MNAPGTVFTSFLALAMTSILASEWAALTANAAPGANRSVQFPAADENLPGAGPFRRQDWFQKVWLERRGSWVDRTQADQGAVVFLGDSITQGWGDDMHGMFSGMKVANRGISGDTTRGMLTRLNEDVLLLHPAAVVLLAGTNDLEEHAEPETIVGNLKLILAALKKSQPKTPVILCQVLPSSASKARPAEKIRKVNELLAAAVRGDAQVILVETWTLFAEPEGDARLDEFPDLLHPNGVGYVKWGAALRPILATLGFLENEPDPFKPEPGFVPLFNGRDLTGWGDRTNHFDGRTSSTDGRYVARNGRLIVTTPPEGRRVQQIWTTAEFPKDFILKLDFRATPNADSGIFIREPQLQCRDYILAGPYKFLRLYKPQDWNEVVIAVTNSVAYCTCNGEILESTFKLPATGPIGLEGDRGQMEYRHLRLKELP